MSSSSSKLLLFLKLGRRNCGSDISLLLSLGNFPEFFIKLPLSGSWLSSLVNIEGNILSFFISEISIFVTLLEFSLNVFCDIPLGLLVKLLLLFSLLLEGIWL